MLKCPICESATKPRGENASFPFCSPRCKTIDLGKWVSEEYGIPAEGSEGEVHDESAEGESRAASKSRP
jgi:uncharacterized protein